MLWHFAQDYMVVGLDHMYKNKAVGLMELNFHFASCKQQQNIDNNSIAETSAMQKEVIF